MDVTNVILRPDWNLLDSTFESYKLSLQQLPIYPLSIGCSVTVGENEFSYSRTKVLSLHNYLFCDPWSERNCYFIDKSGHVRCVSVVVETSIQPPRSVFQLDPHFLQSERHTPVSLSFPSSDRCLISDGVGSIYLLNTGERTDEKSGEFKWEILLNEIIVGNSTSPPHLLHSRQHFIDEVSESGEGMKQRKEVIDVLTLRFEDEKKDKSTITFAIVDWTRISRPDDKTTKFEVESHRTFKGKKAPFYAAFGDNGNELFLGSHSVFSFVPDWNQRLDMEEMEMENSEDKMDDEPEQEPEYKYEWSQTSEDVSVFFSLPEGADKQSVVYSLTKENIGVGFRDRDGNAKSILEGKLFVEADADASNWEISNGRLQVIIHKQLEGQTWPCVVIGDTSGKRLIEEEQTVTEMQDVESRGQQPLGLDQYETCDDLPDEDSILYRFDSNTNKFTHEASVASNQWLFNCLQEQKLCTVLRHDVDALVWESNTPSELNPDPWKHVTTFNALGFVSASKEDLKYSGCSPNASYAALCETNRRVFVYHCPTTSVTPLRNRATGRNVHVSKQQVVTLPSTDPFLGFVTTTEHMFVLTETQMFVIKVTAPEN